MTLSEELIWRGFVNQTTLTDLAVLDTQNITFYHGFDASSDSQTIGNLAAMMLDMAFLRHGHKGILLAGGATSLIGDPGGKESERALQDEATIRRNVKNAETQLRHIFRGHDFTLVNNLDWYKTMNVLDYLRDIGKHFSISTLVQRDYIARRIGAGGTGMSYTEFSYTILQGYDFLHLFDTHGCTLQLAGSDQWGNGLSGIELIRRVHGAEAHVMTLPLVINKATGKKFGKSEDGAVWLDEEKTSVYAFYQFWLNIDDEGVIDYLKIYTVLGKAEIEDITERSRQAPQERIAQKTLAYEVTSIVHGKARASSARAVSEVLFGGKPISDATADDIAMLQREIPYVTRKEGTVVSALIEAGFAQSKGEANRLIAAGAVSVDSQKITVDQVLSAPSLLKCGKNRFALVTS